MAATNEKIRRLPGFRFEAPAPSRENVLPRMDVAVFVGFASSGPIGIPVVLETAEKFNAIFGKDLPLVWNKEKGETVYAYLAPTVRAFFRNGGKRCWVIRVARLEPTPPDSANRTCYNFFPLPGLALLDFHKTEPENVSPAFTRARSMGSWSDDLHIGTAVTSRAVKFVDLPEAPAIPPAEAGKIVYLEVSANDPVEKRELLRLDFSDEGKTLFLIADLIEDGTEYFTPSFGKQTAKITSERFVWLEKLPSDFSSPAQNVSVRSWRNRDYLSSEDISQSSLGVLQAELSFETSKNKSVPGSPPKVEFEDALPKIKLTFTDLPAAEAPSLGSLLVTTFNDKCFCLQVDDVAAIDPNTRTGVVVTCKGIFCRQDAEATTDPTVVRLACELWIENDERSLIKLSDLEFNFGHERFWGNLPTDDELYGFSESKEKDALEIPSWTQVGDLAYFPVAGNGKSDGFYFPIFPTSLPENYLGAIGIPGTTNLQRDGLEEFDADLFLDEKIKNTGLNNLLNDAEFIRYLSARPRPLWGIHSALVPETAIGVAAESSPTSPAYTSLSLEEATIISVPDALQRGWHKEIDNREIDVPFPISSPPLRIEWWHFQDCRKPDMKQITEPPGGNFLDCRIRYVRAPDTFDVETPDVAEGKFTLTWQYPTEDEALIDEALIFVVEESTTPTFKLPKRIYADRPLECAVSNRDPGIYYYRVRAEIGCQFSDWAIGLAVKVPMLDNWVANYVDKDITDDSIKSSPDVLLAYSPDVLLAVQRALLRMCAARGDLFAVLDLPEHYDKDDAVRHIATLKTTKGLTPPGTDVDPFSADETKALSFGAVYHPWLMTREDGFEAMRNIPPGGTICGVMATRAIRRGAWIAPANESLQGVLGLATAFERESFLDFQDGLINLVRQEPTGFLVLDSDTLSDDLELRSINVRRLLSLLRRLALKRGAEYVFEPNDERFRRRVQRGFASLLDLMFTRGAFAGATPAASYQVVVDSSVNTFQSLDQGRFIVELRVAPSLPLKFVTVRLVQTGGRSSVTEVF